MSSKQFPMVVGVKAGAFLLAVLGTGNAFALQPLESFVGAARRQNPSNLEARALAEQSDAEADVATARLLPSAAATATYTRNEFEVKLALPTSLGGTGQSLTIQPQNQLDGAATLSVPLVDVAAWARRSAARVAATAAASRERATSLDVEKRVVSAYAAVVGEAAVLRSVRESLGLAGHNADVVRSKKSNGTASELDVQRAEGDVAGAQGDVASAELALVTAARNLAALSGLEPDLSGEARRDGGLQDDLHQEAALETWLDAAGRVPSVTAATRQADAAEASTRAARLAWLPTLAATGQERYTNATSFAGHSTYYLLQGTLSWRLDYGLKPAARAQAATTAAARARAQAALRSAQDAIALAWHQVHTNIDRTRSAEAQVKATALAAELAGQRYQEGLATQVDVLQAQHAALAADVSRIQAEAELAYARQALRLEAGQALDEGKDQGR
jgi:outer membrane protein TolC